MQNGGGGTGRGPCKVSSGPTPAVLKRFVSFVTTHSPTSPEKGEARGREGRTKLNDPEGGGPLRPLPAAARGPQHAHTHTRTRSHFTSRPHVVRHYPPLGRRSLAGPGGAGKTRVTAARRGGRRPHWTGKSTHRQPAAPRAEPVRPRLSPAAPGPPPPAFHAAQGPHSPTPAAWPRPPTTRE